MRFEECPKDIPQSLGHFNATQKNPYVKTNFIHAEQCNL